MNQRIDDFKEDMWSAIISVEGGANVKWENNEWAGELSWHVHDGSAMGYYGIGFRDFDLVFHYTEEKTWPFHAKITEVTDKGRLKGLLTDIWVKIDDIHDSADKNDPKIAEAYKWLHDGANEVFRVKQSLFYLIKTIMEEKKFKYSRPATKAINELRIKYVKAYEKLQSLRETFNKEYMKNDN